MNNSTNKSKCCGAEIVIRLMQDGVSFDAFVCDKCGEPTQESKIISLCEECDSNNEHKEDCPIRIDFDKHFPKPESWITDNLVEKTAYEYLRIDLKITEWQARLVAGKLGVCADNILAQARKDERDRIREKIKQIPRAVSIQLSEEFRDIPERFHKIIAESLMKTHNDLLANLSNSVEDPQK